jgi:hypothetical protein
MAAALAMMIGGAITNALAFSGSNYLFSHMGNNANDEKIRHDKAMEKLETAKTEWNKERIKRLDFIHEQNNYFLKMLKHLLLHHQSSLLKLLPFIKRGNEQKIKQRLLHNISRYNIMLN